MHPHIAQHRDEPSHPSFNTSIASCARGQLFTRARGQWLFSRRYTAACGRCALESSKNVQRVTGDIREEINKRFLVNFAFFFRTTLIIAIEYMVWEREFVVAERRGSKLCAKLLLYCRRSLWKEFIMYEWIVDCCHMLYDFDWQI